MKTPVKPARTFVNKSKRPITSSQNGRLTRELGDTFAHVTDVSIQNKRTSMVFLQNLMTIKIHYCELV